MKGKERVLTNEEKKLVEDNHDIIYKVVESLGADIDEYYDVFAINLCHSAQRYSSKKYFCSFEEFAAICMIYEYIDCEYKNKNKML